MPMCRDMRRFYDRRAARAPGFGIIAAGRPPPRAATGGADAGEQGSGMSLDRGELWLLGLVVIGSLALLLGCTPPRSAGRLHSPPAERGPVVEDYHGTRVADPYRWLEDLDSPQTRAWVSAEAELTDGYLAALPQRTRIRERIAALYDFEKTGVPFQE